jgi:hypothetical protein
MRLAAIGQESGDKRLDRPRLALVEADAHGQAHNS